MSISASLNSFILVGSNDNAYTFLFTSAIEMFYTRIMGAYSECNITERCSKCAVVACFVLL